jgi:hypothetical protein
MGSVIAKYHSCKMLENGKYGKKTKNHLNIGLKPSKIVYGRYTINKTSRRTFMRKLSVLVLMLFIIVGTSVYSIDLSEVDASDIDFSEVDLSDVGIYFQGPITFYVNDVNYNGKSYAAILDYDGAGNFTIKVPDRVTTKGKPQSIDLTDVKVSFKNGKIHLDNVVVEGYSYSGYLDFSRKTKLVMDTNTISAEKAKPSARPELASKVNNLKSQVSTLEDQIAQKDKMIKQKNQKIEDLQDEIDNLAAKLAGQPAKSLEIQEVQQQLYALEKELAEKWQQISGKWQQVEALYQEYAPNVQKMYNKVMSLEGGVPAEAPAKREGMQALVKDLDQTAHSGLSGGRVGAGEWSSSASRARQLDSDQNFAKYILNQSQYNNEYLYSFTGRSTGEGWVGYGLHFLASGSDSGKGYGFGNSYLVWITQDPGNLQTGKTFVQLYRSYNDVRMVQLANQAVSQSVKSELDIDVYVDRDMGRIMVAVNGDTELIYDEATGLDSGSAVAFRTLDTAEFSDFTIKTK